MIRFSSAAAGDIHMLDEHGRQLIDAMGKPRVERGVITAGEIGAVLTRLRAAIAQDAPQHAHSDDTDDEAERERRQQDVDLGRRAFPLIDMLERAALKNKDVTWGV